MCMGQPNKVTDNQTSDNSVEFLIKRILHAPSSTNCLTFLELGILPIEFNIHISVELLTPYSKITLDVMDGTCTTGLLSTETL